MNYALVILTILVCLSVLRADEDVGTSNNMGNSEIISSNNDDTITIDENGPFWEKLNGGRSKNGHRSIHSESKINRNDDRKDEPQLSLKDFLETYAKRHIKQPNYNHNDDTTQNLDKLIESEDNNNKLKDKSKSRWTLLDVQKHKHPFDDRNGWVSMEPVPWSVSKISKWQSKYKPSSERPWDENGPISSQRPYLQNDDIEFNRPISITPPSPYVYHRPTESSDRYDTFHNYDDRPRPTPLPNKHARPTAYFGHKVHVETHFPSNSYSSTGRPYTYHNTEKDCNHPRRPYEDIITDGMPSNFPHANQYDSFRRRGSEFEKHSENNQFNEEGEWVLLSTTKGYKPTRSGQRSLNFGSTGEPLQTLRASRGVRLTVLPPLKGSNVNMTTSHGGLLQVESTFESVEQAKHNFDKKQNVLKITEKRKRRKPHKKNAIKNTGKSSQDLGKVPQYGDPGAVMAAVGAGMIPATMAMMVPIAMSG